MGNRKIILITIAIVVAFICVGFIGVRSFMQAIYTERSCEWANIDNIEMHAQVDIPEIDSCRCDFNTSENIKTVMFVLKDDIDLKKYIRSQKLNTGSVTLKGADLPRVAGAFQPQPGSGKKLFLRSDNNYDSSYRLALDSTARKLWVWIKYKR